MKRCPRCNRTYGNDEFSFCLDDGTLLSAPYDPIQTLVLPTPNKTDLPPTEMPTVIDGIREDKENVAVKSINKRRRWDATSFFEEALKSIKISEVEKLRRLYEFSLECADRVKWGTGTRRGTFNVVFDLFDPSKSLYTVYSDGNLELNFAWLLPNNQRAIAVLNEFAQNLKSLRGFDISSDFRKRYITVRKEYWMPQIREFMQAVQEIAFHQRATDFDAFLSH